jgi:hypothetical protein
MSYFVEEKLPEIPVRVVRCIQVDMIIRIGIPSRVAQPHIKPRIGEKIC